MKIKKYGAILFFGYFLFGAVSMNSASANQFGCDCKGLIACQAAACFMRFLGLECASEGNREFAICTCKNGAMKHCTNWDSDLKHCSKSAYNAVQSDPDCD